MIRTRLMAALVIGTTAFVVSAEDSAVESAAPQLTLDDLLRLPSGYQADLERRAGATAADWQARFAAARKKLEDAKQRLAKTEKELDQVSETSSAWQVAAPGSSDPQTSPLSLRLREDLRGYRREIDNSGRALRALNVEADLASVPPEWRE